VTVIATLQNTVVSYNTLKLTYLLIVGIAAQLVGIYGFWFFQKRFGLSTKVMFDAVMLGILLLDGWGMIGIWTQKFGYDTAANPKGVRRVTNMNTDFTTNGSFGYTKSSTVWWYVIRTPSKGYPLT
jgi:hypothetical protein